MLETLLLAIGLSLDTFSVAAGFGCGHKNPKMSDSLRMAVAFGIAHILAISGGWLAGSLISGPLGAIDHWLAFGLLAYVGAKMLKTSLEPPGEELAAHLNVRDDKTLLMLSVATAIDALAVGASLALVGQGPLVLALTTGCVVFILTMSGVMLGQKVGTALGHRAGIAGGLVLLAIGAKILMEHLTG